MFSTDAFCVNVLYRGIDFTRKRVIICENQVKVQLYLSQLSERFLVHLYFVKGKTTATKKETKQKRKKRYVYTHICMYVCVRVYINHDLLLD